MRLSIDRFTWGENSECQEGIEKPIKTKRLGSIRETVFNSYGDHVIIYYKAAI